VSVVLLEVSQALKTKVYGEDGERADRRTTIVICSRGVLHDL
jgi:hypothetical protein